jgi:Glycosyl transferase family 8
MPGTATARRLARRYLPLKVRQVIVAVRDAARSDAASRPVMGSGSKRAAASKSDKKASGKRAAGRDREPLLESLRSGLPLAEPLVKKTRALLEAGEPHLAASLGASLAKEPETAAVGGLIGGIVAYRRGYPALAWREFSRASPELVWRYAAFEYARSGITTDRETVLAEIRRVVSEIPDYIDARGWIAIVGAVFGARDEALAREVFAVLDGQVGDGSGVASAVVVERDWLRPWVAASARSPSATDVAPGHVSIGVMAYDHPGRHRASANIGDHIQSLASLGHLVRHQDLKFHGEQELVDLLEFLQERVRPEMQRAGIGTEVEVVTVERDASAYKPLPPNTWTLAFGWFMHAIFEQHFGFPLHRNVLPIFISFHCNKRDLLTPEALDYLRQYGPIGCRDWTSVDILLSLDVPAFFSGCLTTTTSTVFPDLAEAPPPNAPVAYVDMPTDAVPSGAVTYRHSDDRVRFRSFPTNVHDGMELLETYRRKHSSVVTSRLHCWLPTRSLGMPVRFVPKNRADIRFAGLIDTTDADFERIRSGVNDKLEQVMTAILSGQEPDAVYELWRTLTAEDVEVARRRRAETPMTMGPSRTSVDGDVAKAVSSTVTREADGGPRAGEVHVAVHLADRRGHALPVLLESLTASTSRPLHVWIVTRHAETVNLDEFAVQFPTVSLSVVPTKGLGSRVDRGDGRALGARDMDLLVLGDLLPGVDRVVLVPVDAVVARDIGELFDIDLDGHLFAAPTVDGSRGTSGFGVIHTAALRLGSRTGQAADLRRRAYARHAFDFDAFTTAVMVFDLALLRSEEFAKEHLAYVEEFGLALRDLFHFAAGPNRAVIPTSWDHVPTRSAVDDPGLIHWADPLKPWASDYTAERERWLSAAEAVRARGGA